MSSEEPFASEGHKTDEQLAIEQEQQDEERETSLAFQKETRDVESPSATAPVDTAPANEEVVEEVAAVEEAVGGTTKPAKSGRKSRSSGEAVEVEPRKKARRSEAPLDENVRLDRLRQALFRFLDLIEHRATASSFAKALPHIDVESVEALRMQFVSQLMEAIIDESEKLIESNELEAKLASLHRLAHEADARFHAGYAEGAEELKDVWRKELDLDTAISARAIPDQQRRVDQLKQELDQVRKQNNDIHATLLQTQKRANAIQQDARESLNALESAIKGLEATPEMQNQLRQTMDDLLHDLGARV
ncbi:uncharacterized protein PAN0_008d3582 [Moesziomyces antarcticus]|uniref:Uncharacterized protein n=2 Tax=Pseudozyma antarctica TaxID=84753 RepID=A0A5C3FPT6_PSEA2|nr:uncharacterized protein PAN0_008d3582 [Moesziomyces antarcticus]GAK65365.1 conserved hypothetical protein [Moesziomyces antarcticus]SPO46372.1 uncharacterized protein PSANT_04058 [Moesziomyces antarcticus]